MFKIESITFNSGSKKQEYLFTMNTFIYGGNTVGKTALTKALDYVFGSSNKLLFQYQGLNNIDSFEALLINGNTKLWIKRSILNEFFYRRTIDSEYSAISEENYKKKICLILTDNYNNCFSEIYEKVFEEDVTFRAFSFLNFIEEKGLGDLSVVFTKAKDMNHQVRIRDVMNFFFNYDNIEQIYKKRIELESYENDFLKLSTSYTEYNFCVAKIEKTFKELQLQYIGDAEKDSKTFSAFKINFQRNKKFKTPDLIYLSKASFSLAEEIKVYSFMKNQSQNMEKRKSRTSRLLTILNAIVEENKNYKSYSLSIKEMIDKIEDEKLILASANYTKSIEKIEKEKYKIDQEIEKFKAQALELEYNKAIKKIGILENCFSNINNYVDINKMKELEQAIKKLKNELKNLRNSFNKQNIEQFNKVLTEKYISKGENIKHVKQDKEEIDFSVEFEPFRLFLVTSHSKNEIKERYYPGSMARQTHLQILTYLCMFEYLKKNFQDFIYMPLLIIDSANQPMGIDVFKEVYPSIIEYANQIGLQTIFLSKDRIDNIKADDFIDISEGLNKFYKQNG